MGRKLIPTELQFCDKSARKLYRALVQHHQEGQCPTCTSYRQYGASIVRGDVSEHLTDIALAAIIPINEVDFSLLQEMGLIGIEEVSANVHRILFPALQLEQEATC